MNKRQRKENLETKSLNYRSKPENLHDPVIFEDKDMIKECEKIQENNQGDEMIELCKNASNCKVTPSPGGSKHCSWVGYSNKY